ncbi:Acetoacetyl-CoA synthetase [Cytospora mali]|uniref:Acetoacetyl-CoA synthetase n=1 Tax=Cytospora mali TaxID=578113 RepID=A0A194V6L8_CYTMA|nr:Acetoacetyl-CoA synthetase [Valsa mali var. pyri (nom. inval.)]
MPSSSHTAIDPEEGAPILWRHPNPADTQLAHFMRHVSHKYGLELEAYPKLYQWSIDHIADFWAEVWDFCGIANSRRYDTVLPEGSSMFPRPDFFSGARLNFAENLLYPADVDVDDNDVAVITVTEKEPGAAVETTWAALRGAVRRCADALRAAGVKQNDVVAGFVSNHVQALVAMLAAASMGAVWTGISPDNGVFAVLDRLAQIGPKVLFADNGVVYNGKEWPSTSKTMEIVEELRRKGLETVIVIRNLPDAGLGIEELRSKVDRVEEYESFLNSSPSDEPLHFEQLPPSHPLYILYSSGTTGLPKAIIHTAAGTLIQHKKEHFLHCSITSRSRMLYYTTTSWMMWHWSISALAVGASLVLYSGSPFKPRGYMSLPRLLSELKVTHFGTSAAYLISLEANNIRPVDDPSLDLSRLEAIYSTASPLPPSTFSFVYEAFPKTINLGSITGGTDIISLFGAPCPLLPVRAGEIQCAGLGMAIKVVDSASPADDPRPVDPSYAPGDLVCVEPFPCQPLTFFGPGGDEKYRSAYFERFTGNNIWHHGDFVVLTKSGGLIMKGRSDGILKPAGVRFGSAEIYNILTKFFAAEVEDAVCVGRRRPDVDKDETVCLFVVMKRKKSNKDDDDDDGPSPFVRGVTDRRIRDVIRAQLSPRHVPAVVEECGPAGVPKTGNGKKIEVAVKQILSGMEVRTNASVANPEALEWFRAWAEGHP